MLESISYQLEEYCTGVRYRKGKASYFLNGSDENARKFIEAIDTRIPIIRANRKNLDPERVQEQIQKLEEERTELEARLNQ